MKIAILGGGLAGISLAYFLQDRNDIDDIVIFEKEDTVGGLCRSFIHNGLYYDIGPHIFFSKNQNVLTFMLKIMGENCQQLRRSNRIIHKDKLIQYPFENDLSSLPKEDCEKCLYEFLNNPYTDYPATNMLQFFLKIFGEGITNIYLRPYNEKIWKFNPAFMDTQMVDRIPRPPDEHIIRSAKGETIPGYVHQLYFYYPKHGGTNAFINSFANNLTSKVKVHLCEQVLAIDKGYISTFKGTYSADKIISCIPPQEIATEEISSTIKDLKYNSIMIALATVSIDKSGDNFAFMIADKNIIFHRISKIDFLGENYHKRNTVTYMMEYTYRGDDPTVKYSDLQLRELFIDGLRKIGFIENNKEVQEFSIKKFPYAYIIYDLYHKQNMDKIRQYYNDKGILLNGRFGNFEYYNMDQIIEKSKYLAEEI